MPKETEKETVSTENNKGMFGFFGKKSEACDRGAGPSATSEDLACDSATAPSATSESQLSGRAGALLGCDSGPVPAVTRTTTGCSVVIQGGELCLK